MIDWFVYNKLLSRHEVCFQFLNIYHKIIGSNGSIKSVERPFTEK